MRIVSINRMTEIARHVTWPALEGVEKNRRTIRSRPRAKVVNEKSKKPEPRECIPGGLMKIDTSNRAHQRKLMMVKSTVK
jgi:hypothetical protein